MTVRPCLTCGRGFTVVGGASRCDPCRRAKVRERARERGAGWTRDSAEWRALSLAIRERDGFICYLCGRYAGTTDHVVPRAAGGSDDPSNLRACCLRCNSAKRDRV